MYLAVHPATGLVVDASEIRFINTDTLPEQWITELKLGDPVKREDVKNIAHTLREVLDIPTLTTRVANTLPKDRHA